MKRPASATEYWLETVLPAVRRNAVLAYSTACLLFLAALATRFAFGSYLPPGLPFITFFVAVLLATLAGGIGPGVLVMALSGLVSWNFLMSSATGKLNDALVAIALFCGLSASIIYVVQLLNRTIERLLYERRRAEDHLHTAAIAEQQLQQLNVELRHRNQNVFSVIGSLISQSARHAHDVLVFSQDLRGRLSAMGSAQDLVLSTQQRVADLEKLVAQIISPIIPPGEKRAMIGGPTVFLPTDIATPVALVLHELATNCVKYGAWSNDAGVVELGWTIAEAEDGAERIVLRWTESGGPPVTQPSRQGLGTALIEKGVPGASVKRSFPATGMSCSITMTVEKVTTVRTRTREPA